jgi:opacity protein-like surface antigen
LLTVIATLALFGAPAAARADWMVSPFVGPTFSVDAGVGNLGGALSGQNVTFGGSFGYFGPGALGLEMDFGYSPSFFEGDSFLEPLIDSHVTTLMANAIVGGPRRQSGALRPYASGGVGMIQSRISDGLNIIGVSDTALGVNAGGGIMGFFSDQVGIRADVRYFRTVRDDDASLGILTGDLGFWRSSVGVSFRF